MGDPDAPGVADGPGDGLLVVPTDPCEPDVTAPASYTQRCGIPVVVGVA
jgi:hypothetical protein